MTGRLMEILMESQMGVMKLERMKEYCLESWKVLNSVFSMVSHCTRNIPLKQDPRSDTNLWDTAHSKHREDKASTNNSPQ